MFLTFEFWMSVFALLSVGFVGRKCGVSVAGLLTFLLVASCWLIYSQVFFVFRARFILYILCLVRRNTTAQICENIDASLFSYSSKMAIHKRLHRISSSRYFFRGFSIDFFFP